MNGMVFWMPAAALALAFVLGPAEPYSAGRAAPIWGRS